MTKGAIAIRCGIRIFSLGTDVALQELHTDRRTDMGPLSGPGGQASSRIDAESIQVVGVLVGGDYVGTVGAQGEIARDASACALVPTHAHQAA